MAEDKILENFGHYQLLRRIGQGGMAEVYLARDVENPELGEIVIKRLHQELESDAETVDLFLTEADVTLLLDHPNVVKTYDSGECNGRYYIAMEYLQGSDLDKLMQVVSREQRQIPIDIAFYIIREILKGLDYIHQAKSLSGKPLGIVHRDITPSNVWISATGNIKLGDFGVAKLVGVESWTMSGSIKGKLGYFAPEQMRGAEINQAIDLYCTAIILYELLTGYHCYTGDNELDIMLKIRDTKYVNPRKYRPEIPLRLKWFIDRLLNKHPSRRPQTAAQFLAELKKWSEKYPTSGARELVAFANTL